jgi:hypothetical protein
MGLAKTVRIINQREGGAIMAKVAADSACYGTSVSKIMQ